MRLKHFCLLYAVLLRILRSSALASIVSLTDLNYAIFTRTFEVGF